MSAFHGKEQYMKTFQINLTFTRNAVGCINLRYAGKQEIIFHVDDVSIPSPSSGPLWWEGGRGLLSFSEKWLWHMVGEGKGQGEASCMSLCGKPQDISQKELTLLAPLAPSVPGSHLGSKVASLKELGAELVEEHCSLLHSLERGFDFHPLPRLNSLKTSWCRWFCFFSLPKGSFRLC